MKRRLDRIAELDLRTIFKSEAGEFTPWLAGSLDQLSETLGIEIVDPQVEVSVGDFRLDIVGVDANSKVTVAIENQLEPSDHNHLGQLITYSSGIEAGIVIWIASEIRQEHQQALGWLNENSDTSFFGIEARVIQIGDSDPAVDFRVRVSPNDWYRGLRAGGTPREVSPRYELYRDFYEELSSHYWEESPGKKRPKAQPQSWYSFGAGKSGITFGWAFRTEQRFSAEVYVDAGRESEQNIDYMDQLRKAVILPDGLADIVWEELPGRRACRIVVYCPGEIDQVMSDSKARDDLIRWGVEKMSLLEPAFRGAIKKLSP